MGEVLHFAWLDFVFKCVLGVALLGEKYPESAELRQEASFSIFCVVTYTCM